ncbi:MAG: polysaccharide deacetylase family protein [Ginsengibacter sp.]
MKKTFCALLLSVLFANAFSQQKNIKLIIRGDDMGYSHSGNLALIKCYKEGIEKSIEVIVPSPWFPEAVKLLEENPGVDVGVHLAITSEWENIKWRPLTDCNSIEDSSGYFFPMVFANKNYPGKSIKENAWQIADIEKEFRAQIEMAIKKIPRISHISSHMGCTSIAPEVQAMSKKLAEEYHINIYMDEHQVQYAGYDGPHQTSAEKMESFTKMLNKLQPGKTYLFVDHPGLDDAELQAIFHIGYENVAEDRQGVTDLYTNKELAKLIAQKGITLISYKDLLGEKK